MTNKPVAIVYKESLAQSIISDLATFGLLLLCAYVSKGSAWWTLVTGVLFIGYFVMQLQRFTNSDSTIRFYSLDDMQAWLDKQKGNGNNSDCKFYFDEHGGFHLNLNNKEVQEGIRKSLQDLEGFPLHKAKGSSNDQ